MDLSVPTDQPVQPVIQKPTDASDQVRKLGEKIEKADIPADLKDLLTERVSRLALLRASSGYLSSTYITEYESSVAYINWVVSLPWNKKTQDILNLTTAKSVMDKNHYGLSGVKEYILNYLSVLILKENQEKQLIPSKAPILCLVGLAGSKNCVILLDELDRVSEHGMSDIMGVLVELLDPEQNKAFTDHYIDYPFDF